MNCRKVIFIVLFLAYITVESLGQIGVRLEFEACVRNDSLFIDLYATDTVAGGTGFAFGGSNLVFDIVDPGTGNASAFVSFGSQIKVDSADGPWDNSGLPGTANGDYLDMTLNSGNFINLTIVPDEANNQSAGPNTGFLMSDNVRYRIGQVAIPVTGCGQTVSLRWRTEVTFPFGGGGVINRWNNLGNDLRSSMGYQNLENVLLCNNLCSSSLLTIAGSDSACFGESITYTVPLASAGDSIIWYVNDTIVQSDVVNSYQHTFDQQDVIYADVSNGACAACPGTRTDTFSLSFFNGAMSVDAGIDTLLGRNIPYTMDGQATNVNTFRWTPATNLDDPTLLTPELTPFDSTMYVLTGFGTDTTCQVMDSVFISVIPPEYLDLEVRNFVSANGDGKNDYWTMNDVSIVSGCQIKIFSRWGIPVYESVGYANDWDGTSNGKPVSDGTYYYVIDCADYQQQGQIHLVR